MFNFSPTKASHSSFDCYVFLPPLPPPPPLCFLWCLLVFPVTQFVELVMDGLVVRVLVRAVMLTTATWRSSRRGAIDFDAHCSWIACGVVGGIFCFIGEAVCTAEAASWSVSKRSIRIKRQRSMARVTLLNRT